MILLKYRFSHTEAAKLEFKSEEEEEDDDIEVVAEVDRRRPINPDIANTSAFLECNNQPGPVIGELMSKKHNTN